MDEANRIAEEIKRKTRKEITLSDSQATFTIRKLRPRDFASCLEIVAQLELPWGSTLGSPDESPAATEAREKRQAEHASSPEFQSALLKIVLERGVLVPRILQDDEAIAGAGEINAFDLSKRDIEELIDGVLRFSGLGSEAQALEFFRGAQEAPGGAA